MALYIESKSEAARRFWEDHQPGVPGFRTR